MDETLVERLLADQFSALDATLKKREAEFKKREAELKQSRDRCREKYNEILTQYELMRFDPATGKEEPYPSNADQYREWHRHAWLYNPWTGKHRDPRDIGSDVFGHLIVPPK